MQLCRREDGWIAGTLAGAGLGAVAARNPSHEDYHPRPSAGLPANKACPNWHWLLNCPDFFVQ